MKEYEFLKECAPMIAEMVTECQKMTIEEYMNAKKEILQNTSVKAVAFMNKVFRIIETQL